MIRILISDIEDKYTDDFFEFVKYKMRDYFYNHLKDKKLEPFDIFINENPKYQSIFKKHISSYDICISALYNINVLRFGKNIVLKIDENALIPNTNIKLIELCKLINEGNLVLKAYPIFTEIFKYVKDKIDEIYIEYVLR